MRSSTNPRITYGIPLAILAVFTPWRAASSAEFSSNFLFVGAVAAIVHFALRYGLRWISPGSTNLLSQAPIDDQSRELRSTFWRSLKFACATSLTIGLACIALGKSQILSSHGIFLVSVITQQLAFIAVGYYIGSGKPLAAEMPFRVVSLIALAGLAVFFAWSSNVTLLAYKPPVSPYSSTSANLLYAIPAIAMAFWGIARSLLKRQ
jgi:hypothetical protein